jgi:hypothetical protein
VNVEGDDAAARLLPPNYMTQLSRCGNDFKAPFPWIETTKEPALCEQLFLDYYGKFLVKVCKGAIGRCSLNRLRCHDDADTLSWESDADAKGTPKDSTRSKSSTRDYLATSEQATIS